MKKPPGRNSFQDQAMNLLSGLVFALLGSLRPATALSVTGFLLSRLGPRVAKSKRIRTNLMVAFPHLTPQQVDAYERNIWTCFGRTIATVPHLKNFRDGHRGAKLTLRDEVGLEALAGKPFIICGAHVGNWEVAAAASKVLGGKVAITYKTLKNPAINARVYKARHAMTNRLIEKENVIRGSMEVLGSAGAVYFTIDQRVEFGDTISFLGLPAQASRLPARLAVKYNCPILPIKIVQLSAAHYEVVLSRALYPDPAIADESGRTVALMRQLYREIEEIILQRPNEWFCWARRWSDEELELIIKDRDAAVARSRQLEI